MKNRIFIFCFIGSGILSSLQAQKPINYVALIGCYPIGFNSRVNYGLNLAFGKYYETADYGGLEGQISYVYANVDESYIQNHSLSLTGGFRLYLTKKKRKTQFYTNMLVGVYFLENELNNQLLLGNNSLDEIGLGFTIGLFFELKYGFTIGISGEKPDYLIGRVGYNF